MKRLLVFYSHFTPAFKAGGPVQSIQNMVGVLAGTFPIDIVCSAFDLGDGEVLPGIVPNQWNEVSPGVNVLYIQNNAVRQIKDAITLRQPDCIYINGMFLPIYSWLPLLLARRHSIPVVLTPRGMLQVGAIRNKSIKKLLSISLLKFLKLHSGITWHATDDQEKSDVQNYFGHQADVKVVGNVPKPPSEPNVTVRKEHGDLKLVFLSLIARKKNLDLVLKVLKSIKQPVTLDIYGPVKDREYWNECLSLIHDIGHTITYCGSVEPMHVQSTMKRYHAFILLTKGENFGHAIYEALSVGTPVIISAFTPWSGAQLEGAGVTVDIDNPRDCQKAIETLRCLDQEGFDRLSNAALQVAKNYYHSFDFRKLYTNMFFDATKQRESATKLLKQAV